MLALIACSPMATRPMPNGVRRAPFELLRCKRHYISAKRQDEAMLRVLTGRRYGLALPGARPLRFAIDIRATLLV